MQNVWKTIGAALCMGSVLMHMGGVQLASAAEETGSLTLTCVKDEVVLENLQWSLYHIGSRSGDVFVLDERFDSYSIVIDDFSDDAMAAYAKTLENIVVLEPETFIPTQQGATDVNGQLTFDRLADGLYLVCGEILEAENSVYIPSALLFEISGTHESMDWNAYPKVEYHTRSDLEVNYTVKKVWLNANDEPCDPTTTITVEIYRDLELYDTVVLSEQNQWTYEWKDFDFYTFRVKEVVIPEGFTVQYASNETQYLIKNILLPTETTTVTSTTTTETSTTLLATGTDDEWLPQTGQLWWPVILLALGGLILIALGCRLLFAKTEE